MKVKLGTDKSLEISNQSDVVVHEISYSGQDVEFLTAGEDVVAGDLCYLKTADNKYWKADASAEATANSRLAIAIATIAADADGDFLVRGTYTGSGFTVGPQYISETAGDHTHTAPTTAAAIQRIVGHCISTTVLVFEPSQYWQEVVT